MVKFVILFHQPDTIDSFESHYNAFLARIEQMPAIQRRQVNSVLGSPLGETNLYRVLEVYFEDYPAMNQALNSPAGQIAGAELMHHFAVGTFQFYFADVYEEAGAQTEVSS